MTTPDVAPDRTDAESYVLFGDLARTGEKRVITPDDVVHYRRPDGAWTPPSIMTAADIRNSKRWQRVDA